MSKILANIICYGERIAKMWSPPTDLSFSQKRQKQFKKGFVVDIALNGD